MFYLVLWEDKRVSIVEEENVLEITGQMSRIKWGKKEYRSKIIAIHSDREWLEALNVSEDGVIIGQAASYNEETKKIELVQNSNICISQYEKFNIEKLKANPKNMTRTLLKILIGTTTLKTMSRTGNGNRKPIPKNILDTVEKYVFENCSPASRLSRSEFNKTVTKFCDNLRR